MRVRFPGSGLRSEGRFLLLTLVFVLVVALLVGLTVGQSYRSFRRHLEQALGDRLESLALVTGELLSRGTLDTLLAGGVSGAPVESTLARIRSGSGLENLVLFDLEERTLWDSRGGLRHGAGESFLGLDLVAVTTTLGGFPAHSSLYEVSGIYLMTGYAPVRGPDGDVVAGVGAEASADYLDVLGDVRRNLWVTAAISIAGVLLLSAGFLQRAARETRLEERLRRSEVLATMGQMSAMLAHEIRNPLAIIRGAAERIRDSRVPPGDPILQFIPEEVDRLERTLSSYLDFARSGPVADASVDLEAVARETLGLVERQTGGQGISSRVAIDGSGPWVVRGDEHRLRQAILNLLLNAVEAMPDGGAPTMRLSGGRGRVRLAVQDTGVGIAAEDLVRVREPFFTRKEKGSGLGLAIVERIAREHGGRLEIDSAPGKGAILTLDLPARL